jgi:predicted FMN-binding regulatory protein PaiB
MYLPEYFEERDVSVLHALIRSHPLGAWVTHAGGELLKLGTIAGLQERGDANSRQMASLVQRHVSSKEG